MNTNSDIEYPIFVLAAFKSSENCPIMGVFDSKESLSDRLDSLVKYVPNTSFIYSETTINGVADSKFGLDWEWAYVDKNTKFEELGWTRWSSNYFPNDEFINKNLVNVKWKRIK